MAKRQLPSPEVLRQLLRYEPETGKLFWAVNHTQKAWAGKEALCATTPFGYRRGRIMNVGVVAHRVAWAIFYGEWPEGIIDHVDGNPSNNRIDNLRIATNAQNCHNSKPRKNVSGFKGVSWFPRDRRWRARIRVNRKEIMLGYFRTPEAAHEAYCEGSKRFHGKFGRTE